MNTKSQGLFCALLKYFRRGDFGTFRRACDLVFDCANAEEYFYGNLMFAARVAGLIEVSYATGSPRWWAIFDDPVSIDSQKPKEIGTSQVWFSANERLVTPLVTNSAGDSLLLGLHRTGSTNELRRGMFYSTIPEVIPKFKDVEKQMCAAVPYGTAFDGSVKVYRPDQRAWKDSAIESLAGRDLFRVQRQASGSTYFIQYADLALRFRISEPEWAFVIAFHLLPWPASALFALRGASIVMPSAVSARFPTIMLRYLFAASESMEVGPQIIFKDVHPAAITGLMQYFQEVRSY
jgi:hypothetical protein